MTEQGCFVSLRQLFEEHGVEIPKGGFPEYTPHVAAIPSLRMIHVLTRDCSFCVYPVNAGCIFDVLRDNYDRREIVGFQIWCADEIVRRVLQIRKGFDLSTDTIPLDHMLVVIQAISIYELESGIPPNILEEVRTLVNHHKLVLTQEQYEPLLHPTH